ncbi:hypothetical protein [Accumulibacter sp.]|uniref:hypothetical protein n=1 Tax=Accumulibacter sp. TaxID=2053492 RepID=UPI0025D8F790|nr:hypothetical protein [Accumulibacter sp.]MCM8613522.1 hypothetical protein [Accumulibacter sp.]MCM8637163.1 hypothetical protein [Accumulibacter sp.]MCM8640773.1 hypothetical protein [Accumulibacter sp.]
MSSTPASNDDHMPATTASGRQGQGEAPAKPASIALLGIAALGGLRKRRSV